MYHHQYCNPPPLQDDLMETRLTGQTLSYPNDLTIKTKGSNTQKTDNEERNYSRSLTGKNSTLNTKQQSTNLIGNTYHNSRPLPAVPN